MTAPVLTMMTAADDEAAQQAAREAAREARREQTNARTAGIQSAFGHLGKDLPMAVKVHAKDFTGTTWAEGLTWLRQAGMVVKHACNTNPGQRWPDHKMRIHADGSIDLLNHQVTDLSTEIMMGALAGHTPTCIALTAALTGHRDNAPDNTDNRASGWTAGNGATASGKVRTLYTAIAWAQRDDTDWTAIAPLLSHGVTPVVLHEWLADGWTLAQAAPFLCTEADRTVANQWRAAGQFTQRAAKLAAEGRSPEGDQEWVQAGFSRIRAQRWQVANLDLSPADCKILDDSGWTPTGWKDVLRRTPNVVAQTPTGPRTMDRTDLLTWAEAGVPSSLVGSWWIESNGDLSLAEPWASIGVSPHALAEVWQTFGAPDRETMRAWVEAGAKGTWARDLALAFNSGLNPAEYRQIMADHPYRDDRTWSFEQRLALVLPIARAERTLAAARESFLSAEPEYIVHRRQWQARHNQ